MEDNADAVRAYLAAEFPGMLVEGPPAAQEGRKTRREFDLIATKFCVGGGEHVLYVSDVLLDDASVKEIEGLLRQFDIAKELWEAGRYPLLLTSHGPVLILEWQGPYELTEEEIRLHAPGKAGVYLLVEPLEGGRWKPYFVDRHERLSSQLGLFARTKELGRVRCYLFAVIDANLPTPEVLRERVVKSIAHACHIDDPVDPDVTPLAVNLPEQLERG